MSPWLFNFALDCAIRRVQVNQNGLKLNSTDQRLVYADHFNILGRIVHIIKRNAEALVAASKEMRLEENSDTIFFIIVTTANLQSTPKGAISKWEGGYDGKESSIDDTPKCPLGAGGRG